VRELRLWLALRWTCVEIFRKLFAVKKNIRVTVKKNPLAQNRQRACMDRIVKPRFRQAF
jgi:hypothetical protein